MSVRTLIVLALAVVCGGTSAAGVYLMGGRTKTEDPKTVSIVVATGSIARGTVVSEKTIALREWPADFVPADAITDISQVVERTALAPILEGEPVVNGRIADADAGRGLAALIPDGRRAVTIQTSRVASNVAGFVLPGNRVDVLLTLRGGPNDSTGGGSSTTLLQAVEILAVDQQLNAPSENRVDPQQLRSVTLLVTPDQASLLDLGQNMGTLALSLRNPADLAEADTAPATVNVLRFTQQEPVPDPNESDSLNMSGTTGMLAAAASTAAKAMFMTSLTANPGTKKNKKSRFLQTHTLRGRHAGRILVRAEER